MPLIKALPTGTIVGTSDTQTLTNKNIDSGTNTLTGKQLIGTTTNDAATAGNLGEYKSSQVEFASKVSLTNATTANITSLALTAGDWDIWGVIGYYGGATTTVSYFKATISTTNNSLDTTTGKYAQLSFPGTILFGNGTWDVALPTSRVSLSGNTTYYLNSEAAFGVSTCQSYGALFARRVR